MGIQALVILEVYRNLFRSAGKLLRLCTFEQEEQRVAVRVNLEVVFVS